MAEEPGPGMPAVEGVLLAAGLGVRMGRPKPAIEVGGRSFLRRVLSAALGSKLSRIVVVVGPDGSSSLPNWPESTPESRVTVVVNGDPGRGMASSMIAGIERVGASAAGAVFLLADQPFIRPEVIDELVEAFSRKPDAIVVPTIHGRRTTPALFPRSLFPELLSQTGDVGGRDVMRRNSARVLAVELGSRYNDTDVDTPEELECVRHLLENGPDEGSAPGDRCRQGDA